MISAQLERKQASDTDCIHNWPGCHAQYSQEAVSIHDGRVVSASPESGPSGTDEVLLRSANCQRRKTKCSGEKPCKSCSDSGVSCVYERSSRFRSGSGSGARPCLITTSGRHGREKSLTQPPQPSSSDYYLRLAEKRLIALSPEQSDSRQDCPIEVHTVGASSVRRLVEHRRRGSPGGVLAVFDTRTWVNILRKYNEEVGLQYPFVDLDELKRDICNLATSPSSRHERQNEEEEMAAAQGLNQFHPESPNEQICILILTIIATLAEYDATKLANPIVEDVFKDVAIKTQLKSVNESDLSLLILIVSSPTPLPTPERTTTNPRIL